MKESKNPDQSRPSLAFWCEIQMMVTSRLRSSAARRLMGATMARAAGTSIGAPGATKAFCMSITTSAVFFGSRESKRCKRPRRAMTRSMISRRMSEAIEVVGHALAGGGIGLRAAAGAEVVGHVLRVAGAGDGAGHRGVRDDPFEEVLRPALDAELRGPRRQGFAFGAPEERAFGERAIDDDRHVPFGGERKDALFGFALAERVVDLQ